MQDLAERNGHADIVCNALKIADRRITAPRYPTPGMGGGGPWHPCDISGTLMVSREQQAQHLARLIVDISEAPIVIFEKTHKPGVPLRMAVTAC